MEKTLLTVAEPKHIIANVWSEVHNCHLQEIAENILSPFPAEKENLRMDDICIYKVEKLAYDEEYPQREAFENVLMSLDNKAFNFLYILSGDESGVSLYLGVVKNQSPNARVLDKQLSASDYGEIVANNFKGNFNGSQLRRIKGRKELCQLLQDDLEKYENAGIITGIPTVYESESPSEYDFQGIDRLINTMMETNWRLVVVCEPVDREEIMRQQREIYDFYNWLAVGSEMSYQHSENSGTNYSKAHQVSDSRGKSTGTSQSVTNGSNSSYSDGEGNSFGSSSSSTRGTSSGATINHTTGDTTTTGTNQGKSDAMTLTIVNKQKQELMKYIDEELLERLMIGLSRGMFKTAVYYMADKPAYADRLKAGIKALGKGNQALSSPLVAQKIDIKENLKILRFYQNAESAGNDFDSRALMLMGRPYTDSTVGLSTFLTPKEVSVLAGLPQKEVPGLPLQEGVSFGLNENEMEKSAEKVTLGNIVQKNKQLGINFHLEKDVLSKHTFVAGVTGSGKTTTCHKLLKEAGVPFMVIEPAKTEYRTLIKQTEGLGEILVFTLGNEQLAPFRLNPFELLPEENISSHIDMLKATFTSAFPMEASMPQIIEEALILCYERHGWDIVSGINDIYGESAYEESDSFPIMSELLAALKKVVEEKNFGNRLQGEYEGTLISRFSNLTKGIKGSMLNCSKSLDFGYLAHHNVIIEMDEIKTPEDKALLMGFILSRMSAVIRFLHKKEPAFRHLTLVEEAHRLLSKVEPGSSDSKKSAVETFTDLLAEVRKYGEGIIVVDQIPNKLASEVLKNTNTKLIHKLLAKDDKEAVGDTMLLDDKQKEYLSSLSVGEAIVFSENTDKPVHIKVEPISDTNEAEIEDAVVRENFEKYFYSVDHVLGNCYEEYQLQPLFRLFDELIETIKGMGESEKLNLQNELVRRFKERMDRVSQEYNLTDEKIWEKLVNRKNKMLGRCINSTIEEINEKNGIILPKLNLLFTDNGMEMDANLYQSIKRMI